MVSIKIVGGAPDFGENSQVFLEDDIRRDSLVVFEDRGDGVLVVRKVGPDTEGDVYHVAPESTAEEVIFVRAEEWDPAARPPDSGADEEAARRVALNRTFTNVAFYYRDTDLPAAVFQKYRPGLIVQERSFVDCTYLEGGPAARHRYLIVSSGAKDLHAMAGVELKYGPAILARDSFFKVLDVYELRGHAQITLLHFPEELLGVLDRGPELDEAEEAMAREARRHFEAHVDEAPLAPPGRTLLAREGRLPARHGRRRRALLRALARAARVRPGASPAPVAGSGNLPHT